MSLGKYPGDPPPNHGNQPFKGLTALITGSTSGIGLGIATSLAAEGANVVLSGFGDLQAIEEIRTRLADTYNINALYADADLAYPSAVRDLIAFARNSIGPVDILVNNAGIQFVSPIEDFPETKWDSVLAINLSAAFHTIKAALPDMRARGFGRIVNIASAHGLVGSPFKSAYVAAKHGIVGLTKAVALETASAGITCNSVCPGYVWTPLVEAQLREQAKGSRITEEALFGDVLAEQPSKQFVKVSQIGALVTFLCSDAAASITGTALSIDGGWTAH